MTDVHVASEETPILTRYEPGFQRFYAQGAVITKDGGPDQMLRMAFWGSRADVELENKKKAQGYSLEAEAVISVDTAKRMRDLLNYWIGKLESANKVKD